MTEARSRPTPPAAGPDLAVDSARLAAFVDSSNDVIVSKTLDGIITSWNPAAERLFGWTAAEAIGRPITLIIPEARRAEEDTVLARVRGGERVEHFETVRVTKDGRLVNVSLTVSPVRNSTGRIVGASKIARDISERRRFDETRARLAAIVESSEDVIVSKTLDGIITSWNPAAERMFGWTAAEAVGRPITLIIPEAQRAEEEAVLARVRRGERVEHFDTVRMTKVGRLVDVSVTVSHELRTPLNGVFGWARMLQSADMDEQTRQRALAAIVRGAAAQVRLIEDLLDVSRMVTGNLRLDLRPGDLRDVIEAALETIRPAAEAKDVEIEADLDGTSATVLGAADRLQQVLWNLLMNAVKFTPRNGRAHVRLRRGETAAEIIVSDSGEGIAADVLPYVFDRFRQEDSSATRAHAGLGLGLALVRHMVELHGGSVEAQSPGKGQGATFTVRLPLAPPGGGEAA